MCAQDSIGAVPAGDWDANPADDVVIEQERRSLKTILAGQVIDDDGFVGQQRVPRLGHLLAGHGGLPDPHLVRPSSPRHENQWITRHWLMENFGVFDLENVTQQLDGQVENPTQIFLGKGNVAQLDDRGLLQLPADMRMTDRGRFLVNKLWSY